jgi:hypothetical protein
MLARAECSRRMPSLGIHDGKVLRLSSSRAAALAGLPEDVAALVEGPSAAV